MTFPLDCISRSGGDDPATVDGPIADDPPPMKLRLVVYRSPDMVASPPKVASPVNEPARPKCSPRLNQCYRLTAMEPVATMLVNVGDEFTPIVTSSVVASVVNTALVPAANVNVSFVASATTFD